MLEKQIPRPSYPTSLLWFIQIINPFFSSRISANHDKVKGFQTSLNHLNCFSIVESLLLIHFDIIDV